MFSDSLAEFDHARYLGHGSSCLLCSESAQSVVNEYLACEHASYPSVMSNP